MKFKRSCLVTLLSIMMTGCGQDAMKEFEKTEMTYLDKDKVAEEYLDNSTTSTTSTHSGSSSFLPFWLGWMAARSMGGGQQAAFNRTAQQANPAEKHMANVQRSKANIAARGSSNMRGSFGA